MSFRMDRVHVWAGEVEDRPGGVSGKLAVLAEAGANLAYVYTRRSSEKPGVGILYVAPITGPEQLKAARSAGLHEVIDPVVLRVEGDNKAGLAFRLTQEWAKAKISFQSLTMSVLGDRFVGYATFDSVPDANQAATILADLGTA